jgi:hypothetical protein
MSRTNFNLGRPGEVVSRQLAPSPSGVASDLLGSHSVSLSALTPRCGPFGRPVTSASDPTAAGPHRSSVAPSVRFNLADVVAFERANQGSIGDFAPIAISGHARGHTVRQGPWPVRALGTTRVLILSLDLGHFRACDFRRLPIGDSETAPRAVSRPPAHSPSAHRIALLASTTSTLPPRSFSPASVVPSPVASPSLAAGHNSLQTVPGGFHPKPRS